MKGNKGEWSEVYALLYILGNGYVHNGNEHLQPIENSVMHVKQVFRDSTTTYTIEKDYIHVDANGKTSVVDSFILTDSLQPFLGAIKQSKETTFELGQFEKIFNDLNIHQIKANSSSKQDIELLAEDLENGFLVKLGFSIKSQLGSASTLLNAGKTTNVIYQLTGNMSIETMEQINSISTKTKIRERVNEILNNGTQLKYHGFENPTLIRNLMLVDSRMPELFAQLVLTSFQTGIDKLPDLTHHISQENPLHFPFADPLLYYTKLVKRMLMDFALGMVPGSEWSGNYDASGGYIIVKTTGQLVCYHVYRINDFQNYLFNNTKLDTPSSSRHGFGTIYEQEGVQYLKLNRQIRFIS